MCAICGNNDHQPGFSRRNFLRVLGGATGALTMAAGAENSSPPVKNPSRKTFFRPRKPGRG